MTGEDGPPWPQPPRRPPVGGYFPQLGAKTPITLVKMIGKESMTSFRVKRIGVFITDQFCFTLR